MNRKINALFKAILTYCHNNRLDVRKVLLDEESPVVVYPAVSVEAGKVGVKYFKTLEAYAKWLG